MSVFTNIASSVPAWVVETALEALGSIYQLLRADNDEARRDALMSMAETAKAALDRQKFGDG